MSVPVPTSTLSALIRSYAPPAGHIALIAHVSRCVKHSTEIAVAELRRRVTVESTETELCCSTQWLRLAFSVSAMVTRRVWIRILSGHKQRLSASGCRPDFLAVCTF